MPLHDRPRVLVVGPSPGAHGGVAAYVHALLTSPLARDYELVAVPTHSDGRHAAKLRQAVRGIRAVRALDSELVHVHSSWRGSFVRKAAVIAAAGERPVVLQVHGSAFERAVRRHSRLAGIVARRARVVVVSTAELAASMRSLGVADVRVVPNAPDVDLLPTPVPSGDTILFLGRLERRKGVFELVDAAGSLAPMHPGLHVVLAGDGGARDEVARLVESRGLRRQVELVGWVDDRAKRRLLADARCVVLPSYDEGLPLAVLEGMLASRPVVASRVGSIEEATAGTALLVPPRDADALAVALERVLDDDVLATGLAEAAARRARQSYSKEHVAELIAAIYDDVLATTRSHRSTEKARQSAVAEPRPARPSRTERKSASASQ